MRWYISGKITDNPDYLEQFDAAEALLRLEGISDIINPAKNPPQPSWAEYMKVAISQLVTADAIAMLPGWERSRGARREHSIACDLEMSVSYL
jgi:hypothetical protein